MRIGIDARPLISEKPSGIGNYLINILRYCTNSENAEYVLYSNTPLEYHREIVDGFEVHIVPGKIGTTWLCYGLKKFLYEDKIDVFWGTQHMLPLNTSNIRLILTVHDLSLLINPRWGSTKNAIMQNIFGRKSCQKADMIIADSISTTEDVIRIAKKSKDRVKAILLGAGQDDSISQGQFSELEQKYDIKKDSYFLYVGTIEPRKNIKGIIEAFDEYCETDHEQVKLIIAGGYGWKYQPIIKRIERSPNKDRIIMTGYITEKEKALLYNGSIALVFPSHYEGFGFPVLEAMAYGIPVITSAVSSLPEVGGEYAFYINDPDDYHSICKMMKVVKSLDPEKRMILSNKEKEWYQTFSWNKCANDTIAELIR